MSAIINTAIVLGGLYLGYLYFTSAKPAGGGSGGGTGGGGGGGTGNGGGTGGGSSADRFGVDKFFPSVGREWFSTAWANGKKRTIQGDQFDPDDPKLGYVHGGGNGIMVINGDGTMTFPNMATTHRVFVDGPWLNTEQTVYARLRGPISAFQLRGRSNHHGVKGLPYGIIGGGAGTISCGFGCYENTWTVNQNKVANELEVIHDLYVRGIGEKPSNVPKNIWVGFKQILRTVGGNKVKVEAWMLRNVATHNWTKETEWIFDGTNAPLSASTMSQFKNKTSACVNKGDKISGNINQHQVWLTPSKWCWIRMNVAQNIDLKFYSIREISPLP